MGLNKSHYKCNNWNDILVKRQKQIAYCIIKFPSSTRENIDVCLLKWRYEVQNKNSLLHVSWQTSLLVSMKSINVG